MWQERLKDLRVVDFHLTLEELAERTGLSRSALGKYESDETAKDISPFHIQFSRDRIPLLCVILSLLFILVSLIHTQK